MTTTIVRAWTKDGYHRDIFIGDGQQVRMTDGRINLDVLLSTDVLAAARGVINVADFPEVVRFEILIREK